jgi:hypothetical protein
MDMARHGNVRAIDYGLNRMTQNDNRKGDILSPGFGTNRKDLVIDMHYVHREAMLVARYSRPRYVDFRKAGK